MPTRVTGHHGEIRSGGHDVLSGIVGLDDSFLAGMEEALSWLALNEPDDFREYATNLRESEYLTHQNLLLRSYAADGQRYADEAVENVLQDFGVRLEIDGVSTSSENPIRQLLREVTPYCSTTNLGLLEQLILDHYPEWERGVGGRQYRGLSQMGLLEGINAPVFLRGRPAGCRNYAESLGTHLALKPWAYKLVP